MVEEKEPFALSVSNVCATEALVSSRLKTDKYENAGEGEGSMRPRQSDRVGHDGGGEMTILV